MAVLWLSCKPTRIKQHVHARGIAQSSDERACIRSVLHVCMAFLLALPTNMHAVMSGHALVEGGGPWLTTTTAGGAGGARGAGGEGGDTRIGVPCMTTCHVGPLSVIGPNRAVWQADAGLRP